MSITFTSLNQRQKSTFAGQFELLFFYPKAPTQSSNSQLKFFWSIIVNSKRYSNLKLIPRILRIYETYFLSQSKPSIYSSWVLAKLPKFILFTFVCFFLNQCYSATRSCKKKCLGFIWPPLSKRRTETVGIRGMNLYTLNILHYAYSRKESVSIRQTRTYTQSTRNENVYLRRSESTFNKKSSANSMPK